MEVLHRGARLPLVASKRTRALLGYLVATGKPHLRERLCELLWPEPDDPRAALRWSLTKLRPLVDLDGATRIVADRERVGFELDGATFDLGAVRAAIPSVSEASTAALGEASASFRGELLEGLDLPDCYQFHEWCTGEREAARALRVAILSELVLRHTSAGHAEDALRFARLRVSIDPLAEEAHVAVVRLLTDLGRKREALAQSETCRRMLENELGRKPSPALALARSRAEPSGSSPAARVEVAKPAPSSLERELPLVGRAAERARIAAAIDSARRGVAKLLLFAGEPGIGKSRLLEALLAEVRVAGGASLAGRAFEAERVRPYGPWVDALRDIPAAAVIEASPEGVDRNRVFEAVRALLEGLARERGLVCVVLDDVQWLDEASLALLHFVARREGTSLLLACAARSEELADNETCERMFRALASDGRMERIDLEALETEAVSELASAIDPNLDGAVVAKESAGNPLFALEVARARARGADTASGTLATLIADRLGRVREDALELLPWAAAIGHVFDPETLAKVAGLSLTALVSAVDELEKKRILRSVGAGYDFVHDLVRAAAYRRLSEPRKRLVHLQIARTLVALDDRARTRAGEVAQHAALGGDHELAASSYLAAAERCLRLLAYDEAAQLAQRGVQHVAPLSRESRVPLHIALLRAYIMSGRFMARAEEVKETLAGLLGEAPAAGLDEARIAAGHFALSILSRERGDLASAHEASLRAAAEVRGADPAATVQQLASTARCLATIERDMDRAMELLAEADAIAASANVKTVTDLEWGWGLACAYAGRHEDARRRLAAALAGARAAEDRWCECECLLALAMLGLETGRTADALARCAELAPVVEKIGEGTEGPAAAVLVALARRATAEPDADQEVVDALAKLREIDAKGFLAYALNVAAEQDLELGNDDSARQRAEEALRAAGIMKRSSQIAIARGLLARVALATGDTACAHEHVASTGPLLALPFGVSERARRLIAELQLSSSAIPTVDNTQGHTRE